MSVQSLIIACELSLMLVGAVLAWRLVILPAIRKKPAPAQLPRWEISRTDFFLFVWFVIAGGFAGSLCAGLVLKFHPLGGDATTMVGTAGGQLGGLIGIALFEFFFDRRRPLETTRRPSVLVSGLVTFVIGLSAATLTNLLWQQLIQVFDLPGEKQDLVRMFLEAETPLLLGIMIVLACVGAPATEELLFRRGIFRYVRTRLPRWAALLLPACLFGAVHLNFAGYAPLVVLGLVFALAYERTGRIGTSMVAHALFNLNTILLILAGIE
ncbi:MAG TPA: CPBP family intramembrane glutamic endopeptidase [Opitutaceae bacterium]|nr:CPBP family intramembrane glutamic endopeptidase [Opitutaceae bacterium]